MATPSLRPEQLYAVAHHETVLAKLDPFERMSQLGKSLEVAKSREYLQPDYVLHFKYGQGNRVVIFNRAYHVATVIGRSNMMVESVGKKIPCYKLRYDGWKTIAKSWQWMTENVMFDLREPNTKLTELLLAHFWNEQLALSDPRFCAPSVRSRGMFQLGTTELEERLHKWNAKLSEKGVQNVGFKQLMGLVGKEEAEDDSMDVDPA